MIPLTLAEIAEATGGTLHHIGDPAARVTGPLSFDTRDIAPGGLFACLRGRSADGHDYADRAVTAGGAVAVLAARPVEAPAVVVGDVLDAMARIARLVAARYPGTVVGITGSAGKTSTKDLLETVLAAHGPTVANARSFNNEIGFPVTVSRVRPDTRFLVLEMGARGKGHIAELCEIARPRVATVLGVGSAHLGEFGSREAIADAKAEIVRALPSDGVAVLNGDDPLVTPMAGETAARVLTFGVSEGCAVRAEEVRTESGHPAFTLVYGAERAGLVLRGVHGRHHITNALAAAATALAAGVPFATVAAGLPGAEIASGGRMQVLERGDEVTVVNDAFNASPEAVLAALDALADIAGPGRRRIAVLGEMAELGPDAGDWHDTVARKVVATGVHRTIGVGGELAARMVTAIRAAGLDAYHAEDTRGPALTDRVHGELRPGDVVLVKGANSLGLERVANDLATRA
ncbi:UDP-N-acetylmuramoyl-tripeptide--D-alanyl-D-alanine ligase [Streptomyces qinzhouensis]|uniref:UDP-N-acetylmuramoyl-tripeptide--D-alanyl-D-alanine ligase n=1 Tax=Streptomyces qinzhouensis TaxID=2599401 RepID=A0A5B8JA23_9ACTN|nr:UDP-N-acetylmuramoyl-tripeptide--D-alanyl-D-alanine ligase [Streptomyces qinzhouensis]QDY77274.1 UDP-N-acetylmuramoyl-tripeptide--D-alanyl-D-alanine ligase [Streptomyces qinzhouensis]